MKKVMRLFRGLAATGVILACVCVWTAAAAEPARSVVENLDSQLIATMKQGKPLGFAGRYKKLAPVIDQSFDLNRIAKLALGSAWAELSPQQQQEYQRMFRADTLATYASRFDSYSGQIFKIKDVKDAPGGRRQVNTVIVSDGDEIPINYVLDNNGGNWKIVNVVAKGVSDLALKRGQYTSSIQEKGADGFIEQFHAQLRKYPPIPNVPAGSTG
ncbi:ABC transporter substrate-binding protein [Salinisphaera sp.]|uniref:ABC transporter substrate-binding protein n=1 Tax=Salinisphaera sp. TaxID=1914330 RepID=UPI002D79E807|nr:ABC transporter substrate-binding protein [Salinisphaera sp.]HET7312976.1 ABC transporter substrate-binding protein [Salinisphaera sp.]